MRKPTILGLMGWIGMFLLVWIGVSSAINRSSSVITGQFLFNPPRPPASKDVLQQMDRYDRTFIDHRISTILHVIPGAVFLILAVFQFSPGIRQNHLNFHRWSGRFLILIGVTGTIAAIFLSFPFLFTGVLATSATLSFGVIFLIALLRAFILIRRHDISGHREWMIRAFSIAIGISVVRIIGAIFFFTGRHVSLSLFGISFWLGWTLSLVSAEIWIRVSRAKTLTLLAGPSAQRINA